MKPFREIGVLRGLLRERVDEHRWAIDTRGLDAARQELERRVDQLVDDDPGTAKRLLFAAVDLLSGPPAAGQG